MADQAGTALEGYRFHKVLGEGSAARAFEATEVESGDRVVIEPLAGPGAGDEEARDWFRWSWEALSGLDHPNLPSVRKVEEGAEGPFAVREPASGTRLAGAIEREERVEPAELRVLICRLADGLHAAHEAGVVHGAVSVDELVVDAGARGGPAGCWTGFGRTEALRSDDLRALGAVLDQLLVAERETRPELDRNPEEEPSMDEAILAMLTRVAATARDGGYASAAEFRDEVAAGTEQPRGWKRVKRFLRS